LSDWLSSRCRGLCGCKQPRGSLQPRTAHPQITAVAARETANGGKFGPVYDYQWVRFDQWTLDEFDEIEHRGGGKRKPAISKVEWVMRLTRHVG